MKDKYDEMALRLGLMIGNATLYGKQGEYIQDLMAQALRDSAAEVLEEAAIEVDGELRPICEKNHLLPKEFIDRLKNLKICGLHDCFDMDGLRKSFRAKARSLREVKP